MGTKMPNRETIEWTAEMLKRFKRSYQIACEVSGTDTFMFDGYEFVKGYAKYLIEYLELKFKS